MLEKVLLDTDVVLDKILAREPWVSEAEPLWQAIGAGRVVALAAAITPLNAAYVTHKVLSRPGLQQILQDFLVL